ncbi:hypothetical protein MRX96_035237 [Rhipicephalus microplus]
MCAAAAYIARPPLPQLRHSLGDRKLRTHDPCQPPPSVTKASAATSEMPCFMASESSETRLSTWTVLGAGVLTSLAVLGTYLTVAVHPAFLPLLILPMFGLCHVLVYPKEAKRGFIGPPVIRYAMPQEFRCTVLVAKPQPDYKSIPGGEEPFQAPPPVISVM